MPSWKDLEQQLRQALDLPQVPIAVKFCEKPPAGIRKFMGQVPSGCTFWRLAASAPAGRSAFFTTPDDHYNCPIGSYTHRIDLPAERAHELSDVLGLMTEMGYVKMEEVPAIPRWASTPCTIVYSHLADATETPDVVVLALKPAAAMLLGEASRAAGKSAPLPALPRPTCMALPAAQAQGTTMSLGCVGNRVYTEIEDSQIYTVLRGTELAAIVESLEMIKKANEQLLAYHRQRKSALTRIEG